MRIPLALGAALGIGLNSQPAISQDAAEVGDDKVVLSASSDWKLREMDDRCRLSRRFGKGENRTVMWLDQGGAEPFYNLTLIGHPFRHLYGQFTQIRFGPGEASSIRGYISAKSSAGRPVMMMHGVELAPQERDPEKPAQPIEDFNPKREDAIAQLDILRAVGVPVLFDLGSIWRTARPVAQRRHLAGRETDDHRARDFREAKARDRAEPSGLGKAHPLPALDQDGEPTTSCYKPRVQFSIK